MKRFLLSVVMLLAIPGFALACDEPTLAPGVTVESVEGSSVGVLEEALSCVDEVACSVMQDFGPHADRVMRSFRGAILLWDGQVDVTELKTLGDKAFENYGIARQLFSKGNVYAALGSILAAEAKDAEGIKADVLRVKAAVCYYEAAICMEGARTVLETVLEIGEKGRALVEKWSAESEEEPVEA